MTTVNRSSTISQPTAMRPCGGVELAAVVEGPQEHDGARHRDGQPEDQPTSDAPAERATPSPTQRVR